MRNASRASPNNRNVFGSEVFFREKVTVNENLLEEKQIFLIEDLDMTRWNNDRMDTIFNFSVEYKAFFEIVHELFSRYSTLVHDLLCSSVENIETQIID